MKDSLGPVKALLIAIVLKGIGNVVLCTFLGYGIAGAAWATAMTQVRELHKSSSWFNNFTVSLTICLYSYLVHCGNDLTDCCSIHDDRCLEYERLQWLFFFGSITSWITRDIQNCCPGIFDHGFKGLHSIIIVTWRLINYVNSRFWYKSIDMEAILICVRLPSMV